VVLAARALLDHELARHVSSLVGPASGGSKGRCGFAAARPRRFTPKWMQNDSPLADPGSA
jgi:hypothetical protein